MKILTKLKELASELCYRYSESKLLLAFDILCVLSFTYLFWEFLKQIDYLCCDISWINIFVEHKSLLIYLYDIESVNKYRLGYTGYYPFSYLLVFLPCLLFTLSTVFRSISVRVSLKVLLVLILISLVISIILWRVLWVVYLV